MPEIPLLDHEGNPLNPLDTSLIMQSIMWSPKDINSALSYRALGNDGQPTLSELFKQTTLRLSKKAGGGTITANVFLCLLQLKIHRPKDASVGKAVFLVSRALEKLRPDNGRAAPVDQDYVHKFWAEFRPAAHFWGAAAYLYEIGKSRKMTKDAGLFTHAMIHTADALLTAAMAANWEFDPDPWTLPDSYPRISLNISLPPPRTEVVELLKEYRAPVRPKF
jgi:hypothetical protein